MSAVCESELKLFNWAQGLNLLLTQIESEYNMSMDPAKTNFGIQVNLLGNF